jgi:hypothetical protein
LASLKAVFEDFKICRFSQAISETVKQELALPSAQRRFYLFTRIFCNDRGITGVYGI